MRSAVPGGLSGGRGLRRRSQRWLRSVAAALPVLAALPIGACRSEADEVLALLRAADPDARQRGAWRAAREPTAAALELMAAQLAAGREASPDVRESYVYALGRAGAVRYFDLVAQAVRGDESAFVRQAAWLAAARLDPARFRALAAEVPVGDDPWDRIGLAAAWLTLGDLRGVPDLLDGAADGTPAQRQVCSLALSRGLAPLLEAAGRWPLDAWLRESETWPEALVAEVRRRCLGLDLQAIADDTLAHAARQAALRRNVARLTGARERIARLLRAL